MAGGNRPDTPNSISALALTVLGTSPSVLQEPPPYSERLQRGIVNPVPIRELPEVITFADASDPSSWRRVPRSLDPSESGLRFSIESASLQLTSERPGWPDLPDRLPWLRSFDWTFPIGVRDTTSIVTSTDTLNKGALINGYF